MATNSFIALAEPLQKGLTKFDVNRVVRGSYCHNDVDYQNLHILFLQ